MLADIIWSSCDICVTYLLPFLCCFCYHDTLQRHGLCVGSPVTTQN